MTPISVFPWCSLCQTRAVIIVTIGQSCLNISSFAVREIREKPTFLPLLERVLVLHKVDEQIIAISAASGALIRVLPSH
jgi:hypothetical protein